MTWKSVLFITALVELATLSFVFPSPIQQLEAAGRSACMITVKLYNVFHLSYRVL